MLSVLYIDDEAINLNIFELTFKKDFKIFTSESPIEALDMLDSHSIDLVITDLKMPDMDGIELIREIKKRTPEKKCILLTAHYEPELLHDPEIKSIVFRCLMKPYKKIELKEIIFNACA